MAAGDRHNLCSNPSFETSLAGWTAYGPTGAISRVSAWSAPGAGSWSMQLTSAQQSASYNPTLGYVSPPYQEDGVSFTLTTVAGTRYGVQAVIHANGGAGSTIPVAITAAGATGTSAAAGSSDATATLTFIATSTSTVITIHGVATYNGSSFKWGGLNCSIDAVIMETPSTGSYFDGNTGSCSWDGTPNLSTSTFTGPPATISVIADPTSSPPRNFLYVNNVSGTQVTITRTDPDGMVRPVRSGEPGALVGTQWVGYDYEMPYNVGVTYTAVPSDGSAWVSAPATTLNVGQSWLICPGVPALSVPVAGINRTDRTYPSGSARHVILGAQYAKVQSDGARKAPDFQLSLRTTTAAQNDGIKAILAQSTPLLLQIVYPAQTTAAYWTYLDVANVVEHEVTRRFGDAMRVWTFDVEEINRPAGSLASVRSFADLLTDPGVTTYADELNRFATYTGLLTGVATS